MGVRYWHGSAERIRVEGTLQAPAPPFPKCTLYFTTPALCTSYFLCLKSSFILSLYSSSYSILHKFVLYKVQSKPTYSYEVKVILIVLIHENSIIADLLCIIDTQVLSKVVTISFFIYCREGT
jgi:hypothetical protein